VLLETGDIAIYTGGMFGHVMMVYEGGRKPKIIHATNAKNFHIEDYMSDGKNGMVNYAFSTDIDYFTPMDGLLTDTEKTRMQRVAQSIARRAKYGKYRAVRLFLGSETIGKGTQKGLTKYRGRLAMIGNADSGAGKLVTTVTCTEAVVLSYQLTLDPAHPLFIKKDAAHTMPRSLSSYLKKDARWQHRRL
jgi:hypothetical protein